MKKYIALLSILAIAMVIPVQAQETPRPHPGPLRFEHQDAEQLSQTFAILQDHEGFMWFGQLGGDIYRYDGYSYRAFNPDPFDSLSLAPGAIRVLYEDRSNVLWVGKAGGGLNRFDRTTETFQRFQHNEEAPNSLSNNNVNALLEDSQGNFWVSTSRGFNRMDPEAETFTRFLVDEDSLRNRVNWTGELLEGQGGMLWVAGWGLHQFDPSTGDFTTYLPYPGMPEPVNGQPNLNWVDALYEDPQGRLWIGTAGGRLYQFDPETEAFTNYRHDPSEPLPIENDRINTIVGDPSGGLWLATRREGLVWFDPETGEMTPYRHDPLDRYSLSGDRVDALYEDRQGVFWVGTWWQGVDRFDRAARPFVHYYDRPGGEGGLMYPHVRTFAEDPDGGLWVFNGGEAIYGEQVLTHINRETGVYRHYRHDPSDPGSLPENVFRVMVDAAGTVWVGGWRVSKLDPEQGRFIHFEHDSSDTNSLSAYYNSGFLEDSKGRLWVANNSGLNRMDDRDRGRFTRFPYPFGGFRGVINNVVEGLDGKLWFANGNVGLMSFDPETGAYETYQNDPNDPNSLTSNNIIGIVERPEEPGVLWLGVYPYGVGRFEPATGAFRLYTTDDGLPDNGAQGVLSDEKGDLWISTDVGLSRFDPDTGIFTNYDVDDGLQGESFTAWSFHKGRNGELFFGGPKGLNAFYPDEVRDNPHPPEVALTGLRLGRETVKPDPDGPLQQRLAETESLTLTHGQNDLTLDYVGMHFRHPEKNRYTYVLDGYDDAWSDTTNLRQASYTNLPPGDYTFRVASANSDGVWNAEGAALNITILPPWWRTWWAYGLYGLLLGGALAGVYRFQRQRLLRRAEMEQAQLRAEAAEMQVQASEAQARALEADNQRKRNVELLSEIGKQLTASLEIDAIFETLYENVNQLMPAAIFGVGLYNPERQEIDYQLAIERGTRYAPYTRDATDADQFPVWCIEHREPVFINDVWQEYGRYLSKYEDPERELEDGRVSEAAQSLLYLPLVAKDEVLGVITVQSYEKDAYNEEDVAVLQTLAAYTSVALDNASAYRQLGSTLEDLKSTQGRLVQQEKLASLGQLTAGIAHEIKNPLNFVNNFAEVNEELARELLEELAQNREKRIADVREILEDLAHGLKTNAAQITKHGRRADEIVQGMMQHAAGGSGERYPVAVNAFVEEYVVLSYHGKQAQIPDLDVRIERDYSEGVGNVSLAPQEVGRVLLNLLGNALDAVQEVANPKVTVSTHRVNGQVEIHVADNGPGIPADIRDKIFEPFFTTKPTGTGTGLGLSLSYDIITQGHNGKLTVESTEGEGATFIVTLPVSHS